MADLVKVMVGHRYTYDNLLDFLARMHLSTSIKEMSDVYYTSYDVSNNLKELDYARKVIGKELVDYIASFYEDNTAIKNLESYTLNLIDNMYETNGSIRTLFSSVLNRMRVDGISVDKVKEAQELLRVIIVL